MLYTVLVFPRERWKRDGLIGHVIERASSDIELSAANKRLLSADFIRCLRNAVSHARIDLTDDAITFRDGIADKGPIFEVTLSIREAVNLLLVLGRAFHESAQIKETLA